MVSKRELFSIVESIHDDDIQSAYDFILFLNQKRNAIPHKVTAGETSCKAKPAGSFIWHDVTAAISKKLSKPSYDTWFKKTSGEKTSPSTYLISSETEFQKEWIESKYKNMISEVIEALNGGRMEIHFTVHETNGMEGAV